MLEVCYFYQNSYSPSSKGCVFVAECEWGSRVVGKGSRENGRISLGCSMTPDARPLTRFPFRISSEVLEQLKGLDSFQHFRLCLWKCCSLCFKLIFKKMLILLLFIF